jgi:hypothetical protein
METCWEGILEAIWRVWRISSGLPTNQARKGSGGRLFVHFCDLWFCISCISDEEKMAEKKRREVLIICTVGVLRYLGRQTESFVVVYIKAAEFLVR